MKTPNKKKKQGEGPENGLLVFTRDGIIQFADQKAREFLPGQELVGRPLSQAIHAGEWVFDLFLQLGEREEESFSSRWLGLDDNSCILGKVGRMKTNNTDGIDLGVVLFRIQIWEPSQPQKKSASERFSKLMASFAHELRNPLAAIRGLVDLLADGLSEGESSEVIDRIRLQITRMEKLTKELVHVQLPR